MSMPIQRQSESFGYFDDGPRYARDRQPTELPRGLAGLINTSGPRITAGLLNTRQAAWGDSDPDLPPHLREVGVMPGGGMPRYTDSCDYCGEEGHDWDIHPEAHRDVAEWEREKHRQEFPFGDYHEAARLAVNVDGMDPDSHAYHQESYGGPYDAGGDWIGDEDGYRAPQRDWNPDYGYEPTDEDERNHELVGEDDDSGYNWGPDPSDHLHPDDIAHSPNAEPFDTPIYNPRSAPYDNITGSRHPFDRAAVWRRLSKDYDELPPLPDDFHVPDSPEGQPDRSPGWLYRQFTAPHKGIWDIPEHELDDRWNKVYDTLGFDPKTREQWETSRHTENPSDKWDAGLDGTLGGGVKDYLTRAPMSKEEYARHREESRNHAKSIADGLWNALYPPEEEEGRKAIQNMDTVNSLMASGWQPEHIKYDEDDQPYALYQHPSGWNVKDYGGEYKEVGHAATPGESHDAINVSRYDRDSGESHNDLFGPADAHSFIEEQLHGDPEQTGGTFQYLTQNDLRIRRYKPRQAAARLAKDGGCTCWEGYERVPGTEPCASGSCRKKSSRLAGEGISWNNVSPGLLVDAPVRRQDPEDYFNWIDDDTPNCPNCGYHPRHVSGPNCRHHGSIRAGFAPAPPVPGAHAYQPGHRIGLPWRDQVVPGTVIGLDGPHVAVRWDDGQYSSEEPHNIHLL